MGRTSPIDTVPPPSYLSLEEFDRKTSQAIQNAPEVDEDGWEVYDPAAFEAAAVNHERSPPPSSSARVLGLDTNRNGRRGRRSSARAVPLKIRTSEQNPEHEDDVASPPPPFTPTGPSLDGPPFEEVVGSSYYRRGSDSTATPILEPYPPSPRSPLPPLPRVLPPVEPLRLRPNHRLPNSELQIPSNPDSSHRPVSSRPNPTSTITHVEFDPQWAYSARNAAGGGGNHTPIRPDATAFYNHAVASQLIASTAVTAQTQPGYMERTSPPHSGGYTPTTWAQQATSSVSVQEQYAPQIHNLHLGVPAVQPPPGVGDTRSPPPGTIRGPLPPVPNSLSQLRWA